MSGWYLLAMVGIIGGDIFSMFSVIGSTFLFIGALVSNAPLRRFGNFVEMSILGLIIGVVGQIAIVLMGMQAERTFLFQFQFATVNLLLVFSFLLLLGRWIIRRNRRGLG